MGPPGYVWYKVDMTYINNSLVEVVGDPSGQLRKNTTVFLPRCSMKVPLREGNGCSCSVMFLPPPLLPFRDAHLIEQKRMGCIRNRHLFLCGQLVCYLVWTPPMQITFSSPNGQETKRRNNQVFWMLVIFTLQKNALLR